MDIAELIAADALCKPDGADAEWKMLHAFFEDQSREITLEQLKKLEMGIAANEMPIEVPALRRMIRRLATVYKAPASRWLTKNNKRLANSNEHQQLYRRITKKMRLNAKMRLVDRKRSLWKQTIVRLYASDARRSIILRNFPPYAVKRAPSSACPEEMSSDEAFALKIGRRGELDLFEFWQKSAGVWSMQKVLEDGSVVDAQPFGPDFGPTNPYAVLPVLIIFDEDPDGQAWIPPPLSRAAMQIAINAKMNDLMALLRGEAHTDEFIATDRPEEIPDATGVGNRLPLPKEAKYFTSDKSPKIEESISVIKNAGKLFDKFEGLPNADWDDSKTILTGAALRSQEGELREIREEQIEFAALDEEAIFNITRAEWNVHAAKWEEEALPDDVGMEVQIGEVDTPTEPDKEQAFAHKEIDKKLMHPIEWRMRRDQIDEEEAIRRHQHTADLFKEYPVEEPKIEATPMPRPVGSPGGDREIDPTA